jgi:hypothetical protein
LIKRGIGPIAAIPGIGAEFLLVNPRLSSFRIPLAAEFTVANVADSEVAPLLFTQLPAEVRYVLGDQHYNTPELRRVWPP